MTPATQLLQKAAADMLEALGFNSTDPHFRDTPRPSMPPLWPHTARADNRRQFYFA